MDMQEEKRGLWANIHAKRKRIKAGSGERMRKPGSKGAPTDADFKAASKNEAVEVKDTDDYKLSSSRRKVKAHKIVFNKGEDDGKKGVSEQMKKSYNSFVQEHTPDLTEEQLNELVAELHEVLGKDDPAGKWISDFVHSDNPKFAGKSKEKRKQMALAAYYAKMREEVVVEDKKHIVAVTISDPRHTMVSKRKETTQRKASVTAPDREAAVDAAIKHYKKQGYKVHDHNYVGLKEDINEEKIDELKVEQTNEENMKEELKGNQHKLDKNKNGKLDKHDFKLLRKEDADLQEVSHETLRSYFDKAVTDLSKRQIKKNTGQGDKNNDKKIADRKKGLSTASHKIAAKMDEEIDQVDEAWPGTPEYEKKFPKRVTGAGARHDIKATSTGVVATRRFSADDTAEKPENAPKRGRGRPKKDKFAEAVEFLMSLNEEQFNELTSEGFDAFFESFANVVESK